MSALLECSVTCLDQVGCAVFVDGRGCCCAQAQIGGRSSIHHTFGPVSGCGTQQAELLGQPSTTARRSR
jgi:hypothetical protein